jgi:hypothetical protein
MSYDVIMEDFPSPDNHGNSNKCRLQPILGPAYHESFLFCACNKLRTLLRGNATDIKYLTTIFKSQFAQFPLLQVIRHHTCFKLLLTPENVIAKKQFTNSMAVRSLHWKFNTENLQQNLCIKGTQKMFFSELIGKKALYF